MRIFFSNPGVDRNVQILNHCLDDIEVFISKLQKASQEFFKKLTKNSPFLGGQPKRFPSTVNLLTYVWYDEIY